MVSGTLWLILALVAVMCLLSIRAQLRRLVRRVDLILRMVDHIGSGRPPTPANNPQGRRT